METEGAQLVPASERFVGGLDLGLLMGMLLLVLVGWMRRRSRRKDRSDPVPS